MGGHVFSDRLLTVVVNLEIESVSDWEKHKMMNVLESPHISGVLVCLLSIMWARAGWKSKWRVTDISQSDFEKTSLRGAEEEVKKKKDEGFVLESPVFTTSSKPDRRITFCKLCPNKLSRVNETGQKYKSQTWKKIKPDLRFDQFYGLGSSSQLAASSLLAPQDALCLIPPRDPPYPIHL